MEVTDMSEHTHPHPADAVTHLGSALAATATSIETAGVRVLRKLYNDRRPRRLARLVPVSS
jgi:hypothetical protein